MTIPDFSKEIFLIIDQSILNTNFSDLKEIEWDTTMCQDIHHSLYSTYTDLKNETYIHSLIYPSTDIDYMTFIITNYLRPFCIRWHSSFFRNTSYSGKQANSEALQDVSPAVCLNYKNAFLILKLSIERVMKEKFSINEE